jgi:hypothetical protein
MINWYSHPLICAYKFFNLVDASERIHSVAVESSQFTSLYDLMDSNDDLALSNGERIVKPF